MDLDKGLNLILFVDFLEKQVEHHPSFTFEFGSLSSLLFSPYPKVYNAYEGSLAIAPSPKNSTVFFRANRKVCEDWFSRVRPQLLVASLSCNAGPSLYYYGMQVT